MPCTVCKQLSTPRHVKCNGSPVSLTEKGTVFHKTDFKKNSLIFEKNAIVFKGFL